MKLNLNSIIKQAIYGVLSFSLICAVFTSCKKEQTIYKIQQDFLNDKNPQIEKYIDRIQEYFLSKESADSFHYEIESLVQNFIQSQNKITPKTLDFYAQRGKYQIDFDLFTIVKQLCAAKALEDSTLESAYKKLCSNLADTLAQKSINNYWQDWLPTLYSYSKTEALAYLNATCADSCCREAYKKIDDINLAETWTSLSLYYSQTLYAPRLYLDIMQRITEFLVEKYEAHDLAVATAEFLAQESDKNNYTIRSIALNFYKGIALCDKGEIDNSAKELEIVLKTITQHDLMPHLDHYKIETLFKLAFAFFQAGNYERASQLFENLESVSLNSAQETKRLIYKGIIATKQSQYDDADLYLNRALSEAKRLDNNHLIVYALINLADLFIELKDLDMALFYTDSAMAQDNTGSTTSTRSTSDILINLLEIYALNGDVINFKQTLDKLIRRTELVNSPYRKGIYYSNIGSSLFKAQDLENAAKNYEKALDLFHQNNLQRKYLETLFEWSACLLEIKNPKGMENTLKIMKNYCSQHNDSQSRIEYYALAAELNYRQKEFEQARHYSDKVWDVVLHIQKNIKSSTNLELFNQRVYHHLKKAVQYEIEIGDYAAAFVKLENAKAWSMKRVPKHKELGYLGAPPYQIIERLQKSIPPSSVILSYILLNDKSFVFCIGDTIFDLIPLQSTEEEIKRLTLSYSSLLNNYRAIINNGEADQITENFAQCNETLYSLSEILLPASLLSHIDKYENLYIVPDDFLWQLSFCSLVTAKDSRHSYLAESKTTVCVPSAAFALTKQNIVSNKVFTQKEITFCVDHNYLESKRIQAYISQNFPKATYLSIDSLSAPRNILFDQIGQGRAFIFFGHCYSDLICSDSSFIRTSVYNKADSSYVSVHLSLHDLQNVIWDKTDLVILMGCGTARGKLFKGSGLGGIQHWVQKLGVPNVLATLWEIDSYTAAFQLEDILESLRSGKSLEKSLQESQQRLVNKFRIDSSGCAHPFLWASYRVSQTNL